MVLPVVAPPARQHLTLASLRRVRGLWREQVHQLTLAELRAPGGGDPLAAAVRTHRELRLRIAHRLRDFLFLPYEVLANPHVRSLHEKYVGAYLMHEDFGELSSQEQVDHYWLALARTFEENTHVTRLLGHGRRQLARMNPDLVPTLDAFLTRFFLSRMGTHLLGANFLQAVAPPSGARKPAGVAMGVLQPTSPAGFVRDLAGSVQDSASSRAAGGSAVPVEVEGIADAATILYVPGHLRVVLREVMRNAVEATLRIAETTGAAPEPVRVKITRGQFGVFVTVSDRGGGIRPETSIWDWGTAVMPAPSSNALGDDEWSDGEGDAQDPPGAGHAGSGPRQLPLGFGLPLARLTARYFGGDLRLQTLLGHGTNAYIHIPELHERGSLGGDFAAGSYATA